MSQEEALAIVSIYGPASFYALPTENTTKKKNNKSTTPVVQDTPVYTLKVSLEEPDFDHDPTTDFLTEDLSRTTLGGSHKSSKKELEFRIYFPAGYPETNTTSPVHEIVSIYYGTLRLTDTMLREIDQGLEDCFVLGEVVVFSWIEWLRTYLEDLETRDMQDHDHEGEGVSGDEEEDEEDDDDIEDDPSSHASEGQRGASDYYLADDASSGHNHHHHHHHNRQTSSNNNNNADHPTSPKLSGQPGIFQIRSGAPIVDRKSVFVAHLAAIRQPAEVPYMIQQLKQENKKVIKATHNIMAFRVENENGTIAQDNDDDGETAAGSRLLHLMSILDVKNVVVVVSRWYGGIPLSADRFKHINNAARLLLDECGYIPSSGGGGSGTTEDATAAGKKKPSKPNKRASKR
ncbi:hypothetical protein BGZ96_000879 [Linnemannia gamsii]|uniref:RWD domain-containing protein n=1 Tax=Linnemannia gamsii TaxID=64522 RepID=A0ABQ7JNF9_9FUNG|nr:hypothetical protein BGZ96_000879 [Linnemannia gamsii]